MAQWKPQLKTLLKTLVGFLLVLYVFKSKMVDFSSLKQLLFAPEHLLIAFLFLSFSILCCAMRWYLIMRIQKLSQTFPTIFSLTMIGNFFNTFMPGSVGGDLIKAWYIAGRVPEKRTRAIFSVLIDRVIGLTVIICYSAVTLLFFTQWLHNNHQLKVTALAVWLFSGGSLAFAILFFWPPFWNLSITQKLIHLLRKNRRLREITSALLNFRDHFWFFTGSLLLSAASVLGILCFHIYLGSLLKIPLSFGQCFFIIPLALTVSAVPLLPGGIGTGQVAFFTLFKWMGVPDPELGGTLCTLVQIYTILYNCLGAVFYLKTKQRNHSLKEKASIAPLKAPSPCL
ncbi:MAG: flippase-like domain-containing protein [Deltaproteobacteria bacterium]|nr:flippase-like domain-containing protein [Deltaproteobacteria bacterium]